MTTTHSPARSSGASGAATPWQPGEALSALVGFLSIALAIAVAELLAAIGQWFNIFTTGSSPIEALGDGFINLTPMWLQEWAITHFGHNDKTVLKIGMFVTLALIACVVGVIARRSPRIAVGLTCFLVAVTLLAVWTRVGTNASDSLPTLIGAAAGISVLVNAFRRTVVIDQPVIGKIRRHTSNDAATTDLYASENLVAIAPGTANAPVTDSGDEVDNPKPQSSGPHHPMLAATPRWSFDRRQFFRLAALAAAAATVAGAVSRWIPSAAAVQASRAATVVPVPLSKQVVPDATDLEINGLTPFITPNSQFYRVDTVLTPPRLTTQDWKLKIHGMVDNEVSLTYPQLTARPQIQRTITLTCVSNPVGGSYAGNATWIGTRIADLLKEAGPQSGADCVLCTSIDGFTSTTPLAALMDGRDAILAVAMNGEPLPIEHGFPVRMVVPGLYGYVSATKWVVDLRVTQFSQVTAYWTANGWSAQAPIKTASRIDVPLDGSEFSVGHEVTFAGVAWAQHRGIKAVELQIDGGAWEPTTLSEQLTIDTWRQWKFLWKATAGKHTVTVRAIDGTGAIQISAVQDVVPNGATGYDAISMTVS